MRRRDFIKYSGNAALAACLSKLSPLCAAESAPESLKGFIVSDAHFGWRSDVQPEIEQQRQALRHILEVFPDLDLMIDTGDAYHGYLKGVDREKAAGDWTDIIAGETGSVPFLYVPGNHEIMGWNEGDPEWRCNMLGSLCCRPYYSFDLKGIHFVSVPELMMAVYVNKETIEWLKLDLAVNKDKTVILLSHNNILGTTKPDEQGYRGLVNSRALMDIILKHPNIIAWMHGHNHNYEIVKQHERLFVSNGRIGGFDPSKGAHGIGGIYFDVSPNGLAVQCYSAQFNRMLGATDGQGLTGIVKTKTSLDPAKPAAYSYGTGGARDTERVPVISHYTSTAQKAQLFMVGADDAVINEDVYLSYYQCRPSNRHMQLFGFIVRDPEKKWVWNDPGITLLKRDDGKDIRLTAPHYGAGQCSYYRCPPGKKYRISLDLEVTEPGPTLELELMYFDRQSKLLSDQKMPFYKLPQGRHEKVFEAIVPNPQGTTTIYDDPDEVNTLNYVAQCIFTNMTQDVRVHKFELSFADADGPTLDPAVKIGSQWHRHLGTLDLDQVRSFDVQMPKGKPSHTVEVEIGGNGRMTWLVRYDDLDWQFRNAAVADRGSFLQVTGLRNPWTPKKEIIIAPLKSTTDPYLSRTVGVVDYKVFPVNRGNRDLKIEVGQCVEQGGLLVIRKGKYGGSVAGGRSHRQEQRYIYVQVESESTVVIST